MLVAAGTSAQRDSTPTRALVVHVCAETEVDEATLQRATSVAERLLMTAGMDTRWRVCQRNEPSVQAAKDAAPDVVVLLMSRPVGTEPDECGFAHRGTSTVGTAMASVQCVEAFTMRVARMSSYRSHPLLAGGQSDDMVGVVVAHEIGHLLGLQHRVEGSDADPSRRRGHHRLQIGQAAVHYRRERAPAGCVCGAALGSCSRTALISRELTPLDWHRRIAR